MLWSAVLFTVFGLREAEFKRTLNLITSARQKR